MTDMDRLVVLDGGMGTALQAEPFSLKMEPDLWASGTLLSEEGRTALRQLHTSWLDAGSEVLGTATYSACLPLFEERCSPSQDPRQTMISALSLASSCASSHAAAGEPSAQICLSLGPLGAVCKPGAEYSGAYPSPYGQDSTTKLACSLPVNPATLARVGTTKDAYQDALACFHLDRLDVFAATPEWEGVSVVGFETIPLLREALAIRRAMGGLASPKPFYISYVFPQSSTGATFPDPDFSGMERSEQLLTLLFATLFPFIMVTPGPCPAAQGIGINCTKPAELEALVQGFAAGLSSSSILQSQPKDLWLYPDGGETYDVVAQTWTSTPGSDDPAEWAKQVLRAGITAAEARAPHDGPRIWERVALGGCCKTGPKHIRELREWVDRAKEFDRAKELAD